MVADKQSNSPNSALPEGTVTFLFTDIEGSTNLLHRLGDKYISLLDDHHRILRKVFSRWNGREVDTEGDAFFVSFPKATEAVAAVVESQRALTEHNWPGGATVRVRMGLHTGEPWTGSSGYVGMDVHRAARIAHVGHGGQILLSETTAALLRGSLPEGVALRDLGHHHLKDMQFPEHIRQLVVDGLPSDFPPLKSLQVTDAINAIDLEPLPLPDFLSDDKSLPTTETLSPLSVETISANPIQSPVFVGRERELEWLDGQLKAVFGNQGRVVFVSGEAGQGKTALMKAFARQATDSNPELLVVWGQCNAFSGRGDPYLPFREIFAQLAGDVEGPFRSGILTNEEAKRLWLALPKTAETLVKSGSALLNTFVSSSGLLKRLNEATSQVSATQNQLGRLSQDEGLAREGGEQSQLFDQVVRVLDKMAASHPLLLILDDLQWVDNGSIDLLFHLGRNLSGKRIIILAAYRPEDVAAGRDDKRHPLKPLVDEFKRLFGDASLDLSQAEGRAFVEAYVDSEPNTLDDTFRRQLLQRTGGHPLFTVELLRDMQERGDLIQDELGLWRSTEYLDWDALPVRVEGVIESRIGRLEESLRDILTVASVEGESFTARVVAKIQQLQERQLLRSLSRELETRHRLVEERQALTIGRQMLARYRFAHALFQRYFYNDITLVERRLLHQEIATILEEIYGDESDKIAVQLARHYVESGDEEKAISYLLVAGDQARDIFAFQEAIEHYENALTLAEAAEQFDRAGRILMKLGLTYSLAFEFVRASEIYREAFDAWKRASHAVPDQRLPLSKSPLRIEFGDPLDLDPRYYSSSNARVIGHLFRGLVHMTREGDILPDLAARWELLDGGLSYVFHLRSNALWSDGQPLTAADFEFAWRRILDPAFSRNVAEFLYIVCGARAFHGGETIHRSDVGIRAADDMTLVVELEKPEGNFLPLMSIPVFYPVPRHKVVEQPDEWAFTDKLVSNGPFTIETWEKGKSMTIVRNPNYHGKVKGNVGRIVMSNIRNLRYEGDEARLSELYESGQLDVLGLTNVSFEVAEKMIKRYKEDFVTAPGVSTRYIGLNPAQPLLDNISVRRALAMSIDRDAFARRVVGTTHDLATGGFVPPGIWGHSPGITLPFDPVKARMLLDESGHSAETDFQDMAILYHPSRAEEMEFVIESWREYLTLRISPQMISWDELLSLFYKDPPHIFLMAWAADVPDPDNFLRSGMVTIRSNWNHPRYESLIDSARYEQDRTKRLDFYRQADKILIDEAVIIPLVYERGNYLIKPRIHNFPFSGFEERYEDIVVDDD